MALPVDHVFPSYSPEAGLSEWGMGWQSALSIRRNREYWTGRFISPWGRLGGSDDFLTVIGQSSLVRVVGPSSSSPSLLVAHLPDGARVTFTEQVTTEGSTDYAWWVTEVVDVHGRKTDIRYLDPRVADNRMLVDTVTYGGVRGRPAPYTIKINYQAVSTESAMPPSFAGNIRSTTALRVSSVELLTRGARRWTYFLAYENNPVAPGIFYLRSIRKVFAAGNSLPEHRFQYAKHGEKLGEAEGREAPAVPFRDLLVDAARLGWLELAEMGKRIIPYKDPAGVTAFGVRPTFELFQGRVYPLYRHAPGQRFSIGAWIHLGQDNFDNVFAIHDPIAFGYGPPIYGPEGLFRPPLIRFRKVCASPCENSDTQFAEEELPEESQRPVFSDLDDNRLADMIYDNSEGGRHWIEARFLEHIDGYTPGRKLFEVRGKVGKLWIADANGDGRADIVCRYLGSSTIDIFLRSGGTGQTPLFTRVPVRFEGPRASYLSGSAGFSFLDATNDGLLDVLATASPNANDELVPGASMPPALFVNSGMRQGLMVMTEVYVPGLAQGWRSGESFALAEDIVGDNNKHVAIVSISQTDPTVPEAVSDVQLTGADTGLMTSYADGLGNAYSFAYMPAPHADDFPLPRGSVLAALTVTSKGEAPRTSTFTYADPQGEVNELLGYGLVTVSSETAVETVERQFNTFAPHGVLLRRSYHAVADVISTAQESRFIEVLDEYSYKDFASEGWPLFAGEHETRSFDPYLDTHTRRFVGSTGFESETFIEYHDRGPGCVAKMKKTVFDGTTEKSFVTTTTLQDASLLGEAITCLPETVTLSDTSAPTPDDPPSPDRTMQYCRDQAGQVTDVFSLDAPTSAPCPGGGAGLHLLHRELNADGTLASELRAGVRLPTTYSYEHPPMLSAIHMPDGRFTEIAATDPLSGAPLEVRSNTLTRHLRYDTFERPRAMWDSVNGSEAQPLVSLVYQLPSETTYGATMTRRLIDAASGAVRRSVLLSSAMGLPLAQADARASGWVLSGVVSRDLAHGVIDRYVVPQPFSGDPFALDWAALVSDETRRVSHETVSAAGLPVSQENVLHGGAGGPTVVQRTRFTKDVADGGLWLMAESEGVGTGTGLDIAGRVKRFQDIGGIGRYDYDAFGRLRRVRLPGTTDAKPRQVTLRYDAHSRLSRIERQTPDEPVRAIDYLYEPSTGFLRSKRFLVDGHEERAEYFDYDDLGRHVLTVHQDATAQKSFLFYYDGASLSAPEARDPTQLGRLTGVAGPEFSKTFSYGLDGRISRAVLNVRGQQELLTDFEYFADGSLKRTTQQVYSPREGAAACLRSGVTKEVRIDALGVPIQLYVNKHLFADISHDDLGRVKEVALPDGSILQALYDPLTLAATGFSRHTVDHGDQETSFHRNARGLIEREVIDSDIGKVQRGYAYTSQGYLRLAEDAARDPAAPVPAKDLRTYSYKFDASSGLPDAKQHCFDPLGRVTGLNGCAQQTFAYGPDNQIESIPGVHFIYDEAGQRLGKVKDGVLEVYAASGLLEASDRTLTQPLHIGSAHIGTLSRGDFHSFAADTRGTVLGAPAGSGTTTSDLPSPFGLRAEQPDEAKVTSFIGQPYDADLGLVRLGVRDYDPATGRFLQPDPLFVERPDLCIGDHTNCNLYSYAQNDPVNYIDPSGMLGLELSVGAATFLKILGFVGIGLAATGVAGMAGWAFYHIGRAIFEAVRAAPPTSGAPGPAAPPAPTPPVPQKESPGPGAEAAEIQPSPPAPKAGAGGAPWGDSARAAASVVGSWSTGTGPRLSVNGPDGLGTASIRASASYQRELSQYRYWASNKGQLFPWTVLAGKPTSYGEVFRNPLMGVLGSYRLFFTPTSATSVRVIVYNRTSNASLGHPIFYDPTDPEQGPPGIPFELPNVSPRSSPFEGDVYWPTTNAHQIWWWNEDVVP